MAKLVVLPAQFTLRKIVFFPRGGDRKLGDYGFERLGNQPLRKGLKLTDIAKGLVSPKKAALSPFSNNDLAALQISSAGIDFTRLAELITENPQKRIRDLIKRIDLRIFDKPSFATPDSRLRTFSSVAQVLAGRFTDLGIESVLSSSLWPVIEEYRINVGEKCLGIVFGKKATKKSLLAGIETIDPPPNFPSINCFFVFLQGATQIRNQGDVAHQLLERIMARFHPEQIRIPYREPQSGVPRGAAGETMVTTVGVEGEWSWNAHPNEWSEV